MSDSKYWKQLEVQSPESQVQNIELKTSSKENKSNLEIKEINEILLNDYLLAKGLTWNSWHTYPNSIFCDKGGSHFDIISCRNGIVESLKNQPK